MSVTLMLLDVWGLMLICLGTACLTMMLDIARLLWQERKGMKK